MLYLESYVIIAKLICRLIARGEFYFSEDNFANFEFYFLVKSCEKDHIFLQIDRDTLKSFCDENHKYCLFRRDLNQICIFKDNPEEAVKYFEATYGKKFDSIKFDGLEKLVDSAIEYALTK